MHDVLVWWVLTISMVLLTGVTMTFVSTRRIADFVLLLLVIMLAVILVFDLWLIFGRELLR